MGEGHGQADRHEPPPRRRRARAPPLQRPGAAACRRCEPGQHPLRGRDALDADDEHRAHPASADRPRLRRLLQAAVRNGAHAHDVARRDLARAPRRGATAAARRAPADQALAHLRADAGVRHRRPARPAGGGRDRRHLQLAAGDLHHLPRLRRGRPPLGHRARRHARRPRQGGPPARAGARRRRRRQPRLPPGGPLGPWPVPGRDLPAAVWHVARGRRVGGVRVQRDPRRREPRGRRRLISERRAHRAVARRDDDSPGGASCDRRRGRRGRRARRRRGRGASRKRARSCPRSR